MYSCIRILICIGYSPDLTVSTGSGNKKKSDKSNEKIGLVGKYIRIQSGQYNKALGRASSLTPAGWCVWVWGMFMCVYLCVCVCVCKCMCVSKCVCVCIVYVIIYMYMYVYFIMQYTHVYTDI